MIFISPGKSEKSKMSIGFKQMIKLRQKLNLDTTFILKKKIVNYFGFTIYTY